MSDLRKSLIRLAHQNPEMRPHLLPLLRKEARGVYVAVKDLPDFFRKPLREVSYGRKDIEVRQGSKYEASFPADDGCKAFTCVINMASGQYKVEWGSWGGANMFNPRNPVDLDRTPRSIPTNGAVLQGERCGGRPVYASITVRPDAMNKLIEAPTEVTLDERKALNACRYKSSYRADEFWKQGLGEYSLKNPLIQSLLEKGMLKATRSGAISVTVKGKNALR